MKNSIPCAAINIMLQMFGETCSLLGHTELIPEEKLVKKWEEPGLMS